MCVGCPGQVLSIEGKVAIVDFWGTQRPVRLDATTDAITPGDYIIEHAGYAVRRIEVEEVADTMAMYEVILCEADFIEEDVPA